MPPVNVYSLQPVNYALMKPDHKRDVVSNFVWLVNSLSAPVKMTIVREGIGVRVSDTEVIPTYPPRFYLATKAEIDPLLMRAGYRFTKVLDPPEYDISYVGPKYAVTPDGEFLKGYAVAEFTNRTEVGVLTHLFDLVDRVYVWVNPLPRQQTKGKLRRYRQLLKERYGASDRKDEDLYNEIAKADAALDGFARGQEKLHRVRMTFVVRGPTLDRLVENAKNFWDVAATAFSMVDSPRGRRIQRDLVTGEGAFSGSDLYLTTSSLPALFPFISSELIDDTGAWLGFNAPTGSPIVYDPFTKSNYNMVVVGRMGSGKSMLVKTFLTRFMGKYRDAVLIVIESVKGKEYSRGPDGGYESSFGGVNGCELIEPAPTGTGLGFDPTLLFQGSEVGEVLASVFDVEDDPKMRDDLLQLVRRNQGARTKELVSAAEGDLRKRMENVHDRIGFLFEGEPRQEFPSRMVFDMNRIPGDDTRRKALNISFLVADRLVRQLPRHVPKFLVVDEAWTFLGANEATGQPFFPVAAKFMEEMGRTARKLNVAFTVATQRARDVLGSDTAPGPGRTIFEEAATKFLLRLDPPEIPYVREMLDLSDDEGQYLKGVEQGRGLLVSEGQHYAFYNKLTKEEEALFTTKPTEVAY